MSYPLTVTFSPFSGNHPVLKITVTPQISSDTFRSIWKNSKKSNVTRKKKKKVCFWMFVPLSHIYQGALYGAQALRWVGWTVPPADFALDKIMRILALGSSPLNHRSILLDDGCTKGQVVRKQDISFQYQCKPCLLSLTLPHTPQATHIMVPVSLQWACNGEFT